MYVHDALGYNFPMTNINAALLLAQLEKLEVYRSANAKVFYQYNDLFTRTDSQIDLMPIPESTSLSVELLADVNNV